MRERVRRGHGYGVDYFADMVIPMADLQQRLQPIRMRGSKPVLSWTAGSARYRNQSSVQEFMSLFFLWDGPLGKGPIILGIIPDGTASWLIHLNQNTG